MRKQPIILIVGALALGLFALLAATLNRSRPPLLTITETSFPSCVTRTCTVSPTSIKVTDSSGVVSLVPLNPDSSHALTRAISNAHVAVIDSLYEDPSVSDGFELSFEFNVSKKARMVTVRNRYVPSLNAILEECDKSLSPQHRLRACNKKSRRSAPVLGRSHLAGRNAWKIPRCLLG